MPPLSEAPVIEISEAASGKIFKGTLEETPEETAKETCTCKEAAKETSKKTPKKTSKETSETTSKETPKETLKETPKEGPKEPAILRYNDLTAFQRDRVDISVQNWLIYKQVNIPLRNPRKEFLHYYNGIMAILWRTRATLDAPWMWDGFILISSGFLQNSTKQVDRSVWLVNRAELVWREWVRNNEIVVEDRDVKESERALDEQATNEQASKEPAKQ